jgi:rhamnosyl/mannosyltransferase
VLQLNKLYHPCIGGMETCVRNLSEQLVDKCELEVLVCQARGWGTREVVNGVKVTRAGSLGSWYSMFVSPSFPVVLHRMAPRFDLIHIQDPFPLGDLSSLILGSGVKLVVTWHMPTWPR